MRTKLIMEIGCNHQGEMAHAKQMIDDAEELGFWGVKFQKRDIASIPESMKFVKRDLKNSFAENYYDHRAALEFSTAQMIELKEYAEKKKLAAIVSVFDFVSIEEMILNAGFHYVKLPSQFYTHFTFNKILFAMRLMGKIFFIASTGMHSIKEITDYQYFGRHDLTMYCRSIYPHEISEVSFTSFLSLRDKLRKVNPKSFGYSSHDKDGEAIKYCVLLGAEYVERHYTLDKTWKGSDHSTVSSDKEEMKKIIADINYIESLLESSCEKDILEKEKKVRMVYRGF